MKLRLRTKFLLLTFLPIVAIIILAGICVAPFASVQEDLDDLQSAVRQTIITIKFSNAYSEQCREIMRYASGTASEKTGEEISKAIIATRTKLTELKAIVREAPDPDEVSEEMDELAIIEDNYRQVEDLALQARRLINDGKHEEAVVSLLDETGISLQNNLLNAVEDFVQGEEAEARAVIARLDSGAYITYPFVPSTMQDEIHALKVHVNEAIEVGRIASLINQRKRVVLEDLTTGRILGEERLRFHVEISQALARWRQTVQEGNEPEQLSCLNDINQIEKAEEHLNDLCMKISNMAGENKRSDGEELVKNSLEPLGSSTRELLEKHIGEKENELRQSVIAITRDTKRSALVVIFFCVMMLITAIGSALLLARQIIVPVTQLTTAVQQVESGNLTAHVPVTSKDELGELASSFNAMIEQRKRTETKLAASEERLNLIFNQAADGILVADTEEKKFCDCNLKICQMLGYTQKEILTMGLSDIHPEKDLPYVIEQFQKQTKKEIMIAKELPIRRKDGSVFYADVNSAPMILEGRKCLVGFFRDVTDRRRAQKKLNLYASEMEKANEEVKQFAYIVSHDLRAPLVNLKGFSSELRASRDSLEKALEAALPHLSDEERNTMNIALQEDMPEALNFIDSSTSRMDNLIGALLTLSRLGRRELKFEDVDTNEILELVLKGIGHQIEESNTHVCVESLPHVFADRTALEQILGNILSNAVAYLEPGRSGKIEIAAEQDAEETTFYIRDNGRGIAAEDLPKVFAPFRRAGKQNVKGEGMGMAFVQTLVRRHGGHIRCESELGVGTTFIFTLGNQAEDHNQNTE